MKHFTKAFALLVVALFSTINSWAAPGWQEVANYTEDFASAAVSSSKFTTLADYWSVKGTGAIWSVSDGKIGATGDQSENTTDYLITPKVKGTITLQARYCYYSAYSGGYANVTVYTYDETTGALDEKVLQQDLTSSSLTTFTIGTDVADYTQYAIHVSGAYIDNFAATSAYVNVPENRELTVTAVTPTASWSNAENVYADQSGNATKHVTVTVQNDGNVDLEPGSEGYTLSIASQSASNVTTTLSSYDFTETLAVGESKTLEFDVPLTLVDPTNQNASTAIRFTSNLKGNKNTTATYKQTGWFYVKPYAPLLTVKNSNSSDVTSYTTALGLVSAPATTTFTLQSKGGSPVVLKSIESTFTNATWTVDDADVEFPYTIASGEEKTFTLTLNATGGQASTLTFNYGNTYNEDTYTVVSKEVSAVVADPSLYLENFEGQLTVPTGWCQPGWVNETGSNWKFDSSSSNTYATNSTQAYPGKYLISPKLTFTEGQTLTISAVPGSTSTYSSTDCYIKVLYSADRKNWQVAKVIATADSRTSVEGNTDKFLAWGSFSGTSIDYAKAFVIDGIPEGDWYIGFESGYSKIDYIFGGVLAEVENDYYIKSMDVVADKGGVVNHPVTVTVNYANMVNANAKGHTVVLYDNGMVYDRRDVTENAVGAYADATPVEFIYSNCDAGTYNLSVDIVDDNEEVNASASVDVTLKPETAENTVQVGVGTTTSTTPIGANYCNYRGEWIWTADKLGLDEGTKISSVSFKYYNTSGDAPKAVKIYLISTEDDAVSGTAFTAVSELTPAFSSDNYTLTKAGSSSELAEMKFVLDNPYTYDGKNIRVVADFAGSTYKACNFEVYAGSSLYYRNDSKAATDASTASSSNYYAYIPVGYLGCAVAVPTLSGVVTDAETGEPIKNASVDLYKFVEVNEETGAGYWVVNYALTDADGAYSVPVYQSDKEYEVSVNADGYDDVYIETLTVTENMTKNFALTAHKVVISDKQSVSTSEEDNVTVLLDRSFAKGWNTICVPFAVEDVEAAFGTGVKAQGLANSEANENVELNFYNTTKMRANRPYLIYFPEAVTDPITIKNVDVENAEPVDIAMYDVVFKGNYEYNFSMEGKYGIADNHLKMGGPSSFINPTRAYIEAIDGADLRSAKINLHTEDIDDATGLEEIFGDAEVNVDNSSVYDLQGRRVMTPSKGLYIINGKKVIVK